MNSEKPTTWKWVTFALLCISCALLAAGYLRYAVHRSAPPSSSPAVAGLATPSSWKLGPTSNKNGSSGRGSINTASKIPATTHSHTGEPTNFPRKVARIPASAGITVRRTHLMFRCTALGPNFGKLAVVSLNALDKPRFIDNFSCERVAFAAGQGVCLEADRGVVTTYQAELFNSSFERHGSIPLLGAPSRTRVSADGKYAATTVFIQGESYTSSAMSTRTHLVDTSSGTALANLEDFVVWDAGEIAKAPDFNFWGVTFCHNSNEFYATLSTGGERYLVKGDVKARTATVLKAGVECPSLSPDNTRIAFKQRYNAGTRMGWHLGILNLATMKVTLLPEPRSIDDQVEWLDNQHILYAVLDKNPKTKVSTDIYILPTNGKVPPKKFLEYASSPAAF